MQSALVGISTGLITAGATFVGANIDANIGDFAGTAFANYATTLSVGTAAEVVSVSSQQAISKIGNKNRTTKKRVARSRRVIASKRFKKVRVY